jgi:hypothetical protein
MWNTKYITQFQALIAMLQKNKSVVGTVPLVFDNSTYPESLPAGINNLEHLISSLRTYADVKDSFSNKYGKTMTVSSTAEAVALTSINAWGYTVKLLNTNISANRGQPKLMLKIGSEERFVHFNFEPTYVEIHGLAVNKVSSANAFVKATAISAGEKASGDIVDGVAIDVETWDLETYKDVLNEYKSMKRPRR